MQQVLQSPFVDFLSSPLSYETNPRFLGGSGHFRCLPASIVAHGKLWMNENDHPTLVGDHFRRPGPFAPANIPDSIATMRRNIAHSFSTGQGMWWFDFGPPSADGAGGWWKAPALMKEAGDELRLARALMERHHESAADVLLLYDPRCFYYLAPGHLGQYHQSKHWNRVDTLSFEALNDTVADAYESGVVFDTALLDDLPLLDLARYRVIVFGFTPYLTAEQRQRIRQSVLTPGRTVVWVYAPGYTDGETLSTDRVANAVGMHIEKSTVNFNPELLLREGSLGPGFPEMRIPIKVQDLAAWTLPTFQVLDGEAEPLGYYVGSREVAMARKKVNGAHVWFCALPLRQPSVMREIFRQGGAHIYNENNDVVHAGGYGLLDTHGNRRQAEIEIEKREMRGDKAPTLVNCDLGCQLRQAAHALTRRGFCKTDWRRSQSRHHDLFPVNWVAADLSPLHLCLGQSESRPMLAATVQIQSTRSSRNSLPALVAQSPRYRGGRARKPRLYPPAGRSCTTENAAFVVRLSPGASEVTGDRTSRFTCSAPLLMLKKLWKPFALSRVAAIPSFCLGR